jgi:hypothetical protein
MPETAAITTRKISCIFKLLPQYLFIVKDASTRAHKKAGIRQAATAKMHCRLVLAGPAPPLLQARLLFPTGTSFDVRFTILQRRR